MNLVQPTGDIYCALCHIKIAPAQPDVIAVLKNDTFEFYCLRHCTAIMDIGLAQQDVKNLRLLLGRVASVEEFWNFSYTLHFVNVKKKQRLLKKVQKTSDRFNIVIDSGSCINWSPYLEDAMRNFNFLLHKERLPQFPSFPGVRCKSLFK